MTTAQDEMVVNGFLLLVLIAAMAIVTANIFQQRKVVQTLLIKESDGSLRKPTEEERQVIAMAMSVKRGEHFWHLVIGGIVIIAVAWSTLKVTGQIRSEEGKLSQTLRSSR